MEAWLKEELGDDLFARCIGSPRQEVPLKKLLDERVAAGSHPRPLLEALMAMAAFCDAADVMAFCLEQGVAGVAVTEKVMASIASGAFATYQVLVRFKAVDIDYYLPWPFQVDILGLAATENKLDWAKFCLENGANPNLNPVGDYKTVLAATAANGHQAMVELLLQHGAWLQGSGAIVLAAEAGQIDIVRLLLAKGADVDEVGVVDYSGFKKDDDIGTPLHKAISHGHVEIAKLLIAAGASLRIKDFMGRTPEMLAEQCHQTAIQNEIQNDREADKVRRAIGIVQLRLLLAKRADGEEVGVVDPTDEESNKDMGTALHKAISHGHVETERPLGICCGEPVGSLDQSKKVPVCG